MARIDNYLRSMERFGATALLLESDSHVVLRFPAGDRHATQTTPHAALQAMLAELDAGSVRAAMEGGTGARFQHAADGKTFDINAKLVDGRWQVVVEPAGGAPKEAEDGIYLGGSSLAAEGAASAGMEIERTAYTAAEQAARAPEPAPAPPPAKPSPPTAVASADRRGDDWIDRILTDMKQQDASDLHLSSGCPPYWRLHGEIEPIPDQEEMDGEWLEQRLMAIAPELNRNEFAEDSDTDFAYNVPGLSRFRVNVFRDRKGPGAVFRAIPFEIPSAEQLGLPPAILDMANLTKGLVLVTGPTGSGKSTTLASLIDHINATRSAHIVTIEDPIEFVHPNKKCLINQRELLTHTGSFKRALRAALREDPDIVLVGEMRDLETIEIAVETAETGHLVFGTLHTTTAPSTVDRIIDQFPTDRQEQIRQMLAKSLKGVVAQVLCKKKGGGRVAAQEILIGTSAVENLIRERKTYQLFSLMQTGKNLGMQTMEGALLDLVQGGKVEPLEAYRKSVNKSEMKSAFARNGIALEA